MFPQKQAMWLDCWATCLLSTASAGYVGAARAANTLRSCRLDLRESNSWCDSTSGFESLPAARSR